MNKTFLQFIEVILKNEGGYINHPNDPGGETNFGITRLFYPKLNIKKLTKEEAIQIYYDDYWNDLIEQIDNKELALQIFDASVHLRHKIEVRNTIGNKAVDIIQQLARTRRDRILGVKTITAINAYSDDLLKQYKHARIIFYEYLANKNPKLEVFLDGWKNRIAHTKIN